MWPLPFLSSHPELSLACKSKWFSITPYLGSLEKRRAFFSSKEKNSWCGHRHAQCMCVCVFERACAHTQPRKRMREKKKIKVPSLQRQARICCHATPPTPSPKNHQEEVMASRSDWLISFFIIFSEKGLFIARTGREIPCPCLTWLYWGPGRTPPPNL